jgi:hypothetical protein
MAEANGSESVGGHFTLFTALRPPFERKGKKNGKRDKENANIERRMLNQPPGRV